MEENKNTNPIYSNSFRVNYTETDIFVDFGLLKPEPESDVELITSIVIPPDKLMDLLFSIFKAGVSYQKDFKKDIGFDFSNAKE
jgi:hypothetical protein